MWAASDNKTTGIQKILNIFSRTKSSSLSRRSSNPDEIDNLRTDATVITQPNKKTSLQLYPSQTVERNPSVPFWPMDLMNSPNVALHSQQFSNGGGGNVNNIFHISGSDDVHIGNKIQIIQNNSKQEPNNSPKKASKPSASIENGINIEKSKRFSGEQKAIVESEQQNRFVQFMF